MIFLLKRLFFKIIYIGDILVLRSLVVVSKILNIFIICYVYFFYDISFIDWVFFKVFLVYMFIYCS